MRRLGTGAALLLLVGCKGSDDGGAAARPVAEATSAPAAPAAPPAVEKREAPAREAAQQVDIKTLLKEYGDNEVRADNAFKGKLVQVTGLVGDVKKDITGGIYVTVGTGGMLEIPVVQCSIAEGEAPAASALSKGQQVTVRGRVSGLMMNVQVSDCEINPLMKLCNGMASAIGGECKTIDKTGETVGFKIGAGDSGVGGIVSCEGSRSNMTAAEVYDFKAAKMGGKTENTFDGSRRAACFAVPFRAEKGKTYPVDDDMKAKAQAFFDTL